MANSWTKYNTRGRVIWIQCIFAIFVLRYSNRVAHASVPPKNADYSMYDFQFNRVGDTKLDNEVTDCALVKHQYQRGYIRLREYLERMEGCGRKGKISNIEGIADSTVEDLKEETIAEIAKAATEDLHFDSQPAAPPKPAALTAAPPPAAAPAAPAAASAPVAPVAAVATVPVAPVASTLKVEKQVQQTGTQRSFTARPAFPYPQGQARTLGLPYKKTTGAPLPNNRASYIPFQGLTKLPQTVSAFNAPNPALRPASNLQGSPAAKPLQQSPPANVQALYKSRINVNPGPSVTVGKPLYKPASAFYRSPVSPNQGVQRAKQLTNGVPKRQPVNLLSKPEKNVDEGDDRGIMDEALDDARVVHNPDKDIDDDSKVDEVVDNEPNDMPMPGVDDDTTDEGTQSLDVDNNRAGMQRVKQKTAGLKASAGIQNPATRLMYANMTPNRPFRVGPQAQVNPRAGLNVQARRKGRINAAVLAARARAQANRMGRVGGAVSAPLNQNNVVTSPARAQVNPSAAFHSGPATNGPAPNAAARTNPHAFNLDALKNKIMHTTNATYLRHMLQLIRQITHHRDFQKLQGPARTFVNQASTAVAALNNAYSQHVPIKAYSQRVVRPVLRRPVLRPQSYQQPQHHAEVFKKFQIARNPYYAQNYYRAPYYALQPMQYGWYNGNTP